MDTWSATWAIRNLIAEFLMPPGIWLLFIFLALILVKRLWLKNTIIVMSTLAIWLTTTNFFAIQVTHWANSLLEWPEPLTVQKQSDEKAAIVILGGGRRKGATELPQYQFQDVSPQTMERIRYGARLAREMNLPILVSGGAPDRTQLNELSEAQVMAKVLQDELGIQVRWIEGQSHTTEENLKNSLEILEKDQIKKIYLVTHFWHMPRALQTVRQIQKKQATTVTKKDDSRNGSDIEIVLAPHGYYQKQNYTPLDFYPSSEGFQRTRWIIHELLGSLYYRIKYKEL